MTKQEERIKEFVLNVTYGGRGNYLDDTLPVEEFEKLLKSFIKSEIDLALANRNKEIVVIVEKLYKDTTKTCFYKMCNSCNSEESCGCEEYNNALDEIINLITKDNE